MKYTVVTTKQFDRAFEKLDRYTKTMITAWINKHLEGCEDPRATGRALTANRKGQWRYRIGDYRLICEIHDDKLVILAIKVGHRSVVYDDR